MSYSKTEFKKGHKINVGRICPKETRRKIGEANSKALKGKAKPPRTKTHCENISKALTGKRLSKNHKENVSKAHKGKCREKASNWQGGITPIALLVRESSKYNDWRIAVFTRDNFTCQECGQQSRFLEAHHKKSFSELFAIAIKIMPLLPPYEAAMLYTPLWDIKNGKTLCEKCHRKIKKKCD